jgi:hypothetical protein
MMAARAKEYAALNGVLDLAASGVKQFSNLLNDAIKDVLRVDSARTYSDGLQSIGPPLSGSAIDHTLLR